MAHSPFSPIRGNVRGRRFVRFSGEGNASANGRHTAFTLLEVVISISICVIVLAMAVPSVSGMLREQKLRKTFDTFNDFIQGVREKAVTGRQDILTVWSDDGINVITENTGDTQTGSESQHYSPTGGALTLERPAALIKNPPAEWMFWRSGVCEPVIVNYKGGEGTWRAEFNPLTGQGKLLSEDVQ